MAKMESEGERESELLPSEAMPFGFGGQVFRRFEMSREVLELVLSADMADMTPLRVLHLPSMILPHPY